VEIHESAAVKTMQILAKARVEAEEVQASATVEAKEILAVARCRIPLTMGRPIEP
jgi:hypothetical protein